LGAAAGQIASDLAAGTAMADIEGAGVFSDGEKGIPVTAILLDPTPLTRANLNVAIDAGHISKEQACEGAIADVAGC
jgi:D-xylose transport system substrate-binding protein